MNHRLELLSPAKDADCGIAAVNHGADAVYIGAAKFSARKAAGNSLKDIERLIQHAHLFKSRVYIALNTLFYDNELEDAVKLAWQLYEAGADALIVQDFGLAASELPPIQLHASTQMDNRSPEKVKFLEKVGFSQVVLARELNLDQIKNIAASVTIPLEFFIHGALCVSYSGQCYISQTMSGRSANRGECAQYCRHKFDLRDAEGKLLERDKYLLSLKDLRLDQRIEELIDAGISSFKIEGRLKPVHYVKNITAYYRNILDEILHRRPELSSQSSGSCSFDFTPDPDKTFNRGSSEYFLSGGIQRPGSIRTPKSLGEKIGTVLESSRGEFKLKEAHRLANGDGLCFFMGNNLQGCAVQKVVGNSVLHRSSEIPPIGTVIYRNENLNFYHELDKSETPRTIALSVHIRAQQGEFHCVAEDEDGCVSSLKKNPEFQPASQKGILEETLERQFRKTGGTFFTMDQLEVDSDETYFLPISQVNSIRRELLELHEKNRKALYLRPQRAAADPDAFWAEDTVNFQAQILNARAEEFYRKHGVKHFSVQGIEKDDPIMQTKYCMKAQLNMCPRVFGSQPSVSEPFTLEDRQAAYRLEFDCAACEMKVYRL
jgi:collagenase-like PrtC family protease